MEIMEPEHYNIVKLMQTCQEKLQDPFFFPSKGKQIETVSFPALPQVLLLF
jgi:hypothetical protein